MPEGLDLLSKELTPEQAKQLTLEDVARGMYQLHTKILDHKKQIEEGIRTKPESIAEVKKELEDLHRGMNELREKAVKTPTDKRHGEIAARKGGLFGDNVPLLMPWDIVSLSEKSDSLRGNDAERVHDFHDAWDQYVIRRWMMAQDPQVGEGGKYWDRVDKAMVGTREWRRLQNAAEDCCFERELLHPAQSHEKQKALYQQIEKGDIIHPSAGGTANILTATVMSSTILDLVRLQLRVANQFNTFPVTNWSQDVPVNRGDMIGVRGGTATANVPPHTQAGSPTNLIPAAAVFGTVSFGKITFTMKDVLSFLWWTDRTQQDAVPALVPYFRNQVSFGLARAVDRACMSGDIAGVTQGNHMDDWADAFTVEDARTLWDGLRLLTITNQSTALAAAFDSAADMNLLLKKLGIYGQSPELLRCWMPISVIYDLLDDAAVHTIDTFGPQATIKSGTLARMYGIDLIPTEWIPTDQASTGLSANGGTKGSVTLARIDRFLLAEHGTIQVEQTRWAPQLATILQATARYDFKPIEALSSGKLPAGVNTPAHTIRDVTL